MFPHVRLKRFIYMVLRDGFQDTFVDVGGHIYSRVGEYGDFYRDLSRYYLCQRGFPWATALDIISGGHIGHLNIGPGWLPWPTGLHTSGPWPNLASFGG